jgi:hypothetical protein
MQKEERSEVAQDRQSESRREIGIQTLQLEAGIYTQNLLPKRICRRTEKTEYSQDKS